MSKPHTNYRVESASPKPNRVKAKDVDVFDIIRWQGQYHQVIHTIDSPHTNHDPCIGARQITTNGFQTFAAYSEIRGDAEVLVAEEVHITVRIADDEEGEQIV